MRKNVTLVINQYKIGNIFDTANERFGFDQKTKSAFIKIFFSNT